MLANERDLEYRDRVRGSLLGGAIGDALGAGVEFESIDVIRREHGPRGVTGFTYAHEQQAPITDDTQMTLFTAEGLIRASAGGHDMSGAPAVVHNAYLRWLTTQGEPARPTGEPGWLVTQSVLHARRAPGNSCLSGLSAGFVGTRRTPANPDSKGCGAAMRSAPFGWLPRDNDEIWNLAIDCAVFTTGIRRGITRLPPSPSSSGTSS